MRLESHYPKRLYFVLAILVFGQEFNPVLANSAVHMKDGFVQEKDNLRDNESGKDITEETIQGKRGIHGALFAVSVGTSLINLGLTILLKVKGCCVFYRSICRNTKEFNRRSKDLAKKLNDTTDEWEKVKQLRKWIKKSNNQNAAVWIEVRRIGDLQDNIVKLLNPDIIKEFNNKEHKIWQLVKKGDKRTLGMTYVEFDNLYQQAFSSVEDTALRLASITGLVGGSAISFAFKHYKLAKIQKALRTSYGSKLLKAGPGAKKFFGFSKASMKLHLKQTSKSMYKAKFSGLKFARYMKFAGSVVSVVSIASDVYEIIKKIRGCRKVRNNARDGVKKVKEAQGKVNKLARDIQIYKRELHTRGYTFVKEQINSKDLHAVLGSIRDMTKAASNKARDLKSAAPVLDRFLAQINTANDAQITELQKQLIRALKKVTVYLTCYYNKLRMVTYVVDYCKKGHADVQSLFNQANRVFNSNSKFCRTKNGFAYTTLESVKSLIRSRSKKKWFNFDCLLNSKKNKDKACRMKWGGYSIKQITARMPGVKPHHVKHYLISCGQQPITPQLEHQICYLRKRCINEKFVSSFLSITQKRILTIECPCQEFSSK